MNQGSEDQPEVERQNNKRIRQIKSIISEVRAFGRVAHFVEKHQRGNVNNRNLL